ncbi:peptide chain release factor 2 [bacterium]|nr:peptide chain release factor 2 [bacterium]
MYDDMKRQLDTNQSRIDELRGIFDIDGKTEQIKILESETTQAGFWDDNENAQTVLKQITVLKSWTESWYKASQHCEELELLLELAHEEEDQATFDEIGTGLEKLEKQVTDLEFRRMLGGEDDARNAILTIHPGAGGTESQDWAEMLFRMYMRYCQRQDFTANVMDYQDGDEAGIKSVSIEVVGPSAYGYLKAEAGVHRLVRISPFDSNKRRHTSFASVFVYPELDDDIDVQINPSDLRVDTYRASGAGGQHVNKTSSAVRITHIPTGIVVQCQNERSQHQNKANAMKILAARLYQKEKEEEEKKREAMESQKKDIAWGHQIRSYVFHPYNMVKDHRTDVETSNIQEVMDGGLDDFIREFLLKFSQ